MFVLFPLLCVLRDLVCMPQVKFVIIWVCPNRLLEVGLRYLWVFCCELLYQQCCVCCGVQLAVGAEVVTYLGGVYIVECGWVWYWFSAVQASEWHAVADGCVVCCSKH